MANRGVMAAPTNDRAENFLYVRSDDRIAAGLYPVIDVGVGGRGCKVSLPA